MNLSVVAVAIASGLCVCSSSFARADAHRSNVTSTTQSVPVYRGSLVYSEDFELFSNGQLTPQGGWSSQFPNNAEVTEINPISGARSARHASDGTSVPGFEMITPEFANEHQQVSANIRISGMGSSYQLVTRDLTFEQFNARVSFDTDGRIRVSQSSLDGLGNVQVTFVDTGVDWLIDTQYTVGIETFADGSLDVDLNGMEIFSGLDAIFATQGVAGKSGQFLVYAGNEGSGSFDGTGDTLTLDDVGVIPAPGTLALVSLASAGLVRRRR